MSIQAIATLAREHFDRAGIRKQKKTIGAFLDTYPSTTEQTAGDSFYLWYYLQYMTTDYLPVFVMLPKEDVGPFDSLSVQYVDFFDEETGEEELDFWSIDLSIVNGSVDRVAECSTEEVTTELQRKLLRHLKAIKSLPEDADDEFEFTSLELMTAMALSIYESQGQEQLANPSTTII